MSGASCLLLTSLSFLRVATGLPVTGLPAAALTAVTGGLTTAGSGVERGGACSGSVDGGCWLSLVSASSPLQKFKVFEIINVHTFTCICTHFSLVCLNKHILREQMY